MTANDIQVGGTHYKTAYEHWDWCIDTGLGLGHLIGSATKYVSRWRKKNGVQDLQKALHYINKLAEAVETGRVRLVPHGPDSGAKVAVTTNKFGGANNLSSQELDVCQLLVMARSTEDLYHARDLVLALMDQIPPAKPVPLTDSNKHAFRAGDDTDAV